MTSNYGALESDLKKLEKISNLPINRDRFTVIAGSRFAVIDGPLRILVYEKKTISERKLNTILNNNSFWDLAFVVKEKITIVNKLNIPYAKF